MEKTLIPTEYKTIMVSIYNSTLEMEIETTCNEMLKDGFVFVSTVASIEQITAILLFAKY